MQPAPQDTCYVARGGQTYGPCTWAQVVEHSRGGRIGKGDQILDPRTGRWTEPSKVAGLFGSGGTASVSLGLSVAAKIAIIALISLALISAGVTTFVYLNSKGHYVESPDLVTGVSEFVEGSGTTAALATEVPPEGRTDKGTFYWESGEGPGLPNLAHDDVCYSWIYTTGEGTAASFDFGTVEGWPVYLVSQTGSRYVFESSTRSLVERVRITADITDAKMSGEVVNINNVSSFLNGTFSGEAITYEQYKAEAD